MNRGVRETGSRRDTDYEALMAIPFESCGGIPAAYEPTKARIQEAKLRHWNQTVSSESYKPMANQRKRIGPLNTAGSVAIENARVYKELRRGRIEPLASRLSQILLNQRVIQESFDAEKRIEQLEALLEKAGHGKLLPMKAANG
jgi:hypothetical protein